MKTTLIGGKQFKLKPALISAVVPLNNPNSDTLFHWNFSAVSTGGFQNLASITYTPKQNIVLVKIQGGGFQENGAPPVPAAIIDFKLDILTPSDSVPFFSGSNAIFDPGAVEDLNNYSSYFSSSIDQAEPKLIFYGSKGYGFSVSALNGTVGYFINFDLFLTFRNL